MSKWPKDGIRKLRRAAQMTQKDFAEWLGVSKMHVSHLERGFRKAGRQTVRLLEILQKQIRGKGKKRR
jgi:DNA-binding transcriptional regulator YiaG